MKVVTIRITNRETGKVKENNYIEATEAEAMKEAKKHPYKNEMLDPGKYDFEIIKVIEGKSQGSRVKKFVDRYGYKPAFGDYEATGWMEE